MQIDNNIDAFLLEDKQIDNMMPEGEVSIPQESSSIVERPFVGDSQAQDKKPASIVIEPPDKRDDPKIDEIRRELSNVQDRDEDGDLSSQEIKALGKDPVSIKLPEIAELEESMRQLLRELLPHIRSGEYSLLIGDDISGRIPTLLIRKFINTIRTENGQKEIPTYFFRSKAEASKISPDSISSLIAFAKTAVTGSTIDSKALVITEYISSGRHIRQTGSILSQSDIPYDVATVYMDVPEQVYRMGGIIPETTRLFSGGQDNYPKIYSNPDISGVVGEKDTDRRTVINKNDLRRSTIIQARKDVDVLANRLITELA